MSGPTVRRRVRALLGAALAAVVLFFVVYWLAVQTAWGQRLGESALLGRVATERAYGDARALLATISIGSLALIGGAIVLVALARRRPRLAVGAFVLVLGANVTTEVLKRYVLPRPDLLPADLREGGPSFPSGHSTVAMSLALALVLVVPHRLRTPAAVAGLVYAVGVGVAVIVAGWHRPSDAYGAYFVAFAWACLVAAVLVEERGLGLISEQNGRPVGGRLLLVSGLAILAVAFAVLLAVGATRYSDDLSIPTPDRAFAAGALTVGGLGALLVGALLWLLRGASLDAPGYLERRKRGSVVSS